MSKIYVVDNKTDLQVQESKPALKEPVLYKVVLHNDDFTPMDFVVAVLEMFFNMEKALAVERMQEIHRTGRAICGTYSKDVAETKAYYVMEYARKHDHPLLCSIEAT